MSLGEVEAGTKTNGHQYANFQDSDGRGTEQVKRGQMNPDHLSGHFLWARPWAPLWDVSWELSW